MAKAHPEIVVRRRCKQRRLAVPGPSEGFAWRRQGALTLVVPDGKPNSSWRDEELPFRSLAFDRQGRVVSAGLPKFFEHAAAPELARDFDRALRDGEPVLTTVKQDGSLVIRAVHRGRVWWRTRSSLAPEHISRRAEALAAERYPALADPGLLDGWSLLFEHVSPAHRIVIPYEREDLILIGAVDNATLQLADWEWLERLAAGHSLRLTECLERPAGLATLKAELDRRSDIEGVVLRWGQRLLKVKGADYVAAHRLRYELHPRKIRMLLAKSDIASAEELAKRLGVSDERGRTYLAKIYKRHLELDRDVDVELKRLAKLAEANAALTNKRFFRQVAAPLGSPRAEALVELRRNRPERARELLERRWVNERFGDPA